MKFYATKWVLTKGIIEFEGEVSAGKYASDMTALNAGSSFFLRLDSEAFQTLEEAQANAMKRALDCVRFTEIRLEKAYAQLVAFRVEIPVSRKSQTSEEIS